MFQKIWRWIKKLWQKLFGKPKPQKKKSQPKLLAPVKPFTDTDYEFLFNQLLEGVEHGWSSDRVDRFFKDLSHRANTQEWTGWLERFKETVLASSAPNQILAHKLLLFGDLTRSLTRIAELSDIATAIGTELINRVSDSGVVWEYNGQDQGSPQPLTQEALMEWLEHPEMIATDDFQSWYWRGIILGNMGRNQEALESYQKSLEIKPDDFQTWNNLGAILFNLGKLEEALASYNKVIEFQPDFYTAWNNKAVTLYNLGRLEEALTTYDQAIAINPNESAAWNNKASLLVKLERLEEALASYNKALELNADYFGTWASRAHINLLLGNYEIALEDANRAISLKDDDPLAWQYKIQALEKLDRLEEAQLYYAKLQSLIPNI